MTISLGNLALPWMLIAAAAAPASDNGGNGGNVAKATKAAKPKPPAPKAAHALVPIPLKLPKPVFAPTPRPIPPGTRVKVRKGPAKPRPPFLAPKGVRNVALGKPVLSSERDPVIGELKLVTDGKKEADCGCLVELGPDVQWVQIDLAKVYTIHAVVVWHEHGDRRVYHDVIVQVSDDKDFITGVRTLFNNDHDNSAGQGLGEDWGYFETNEGLLVDAKGVKARYVRLYSNGSTADDLNRYAEVEVYGRPSEPTRHHR